MRKAARWRGGGAHSLLAPRLLRIHRVRHPRLLALVALVLALLALAPASIAQTQPPDQSPTTIPAGAVSIGEGFAFTGAVVNPMGSGGRRTMTGYQAAVFVQSWLEDAFFGNPTLQDPPPAAPVFRLDVTGLWGDSTGTLSIYYASDGTTAWISFPQNQAPSSPPPTPPSPTGWFIGQPRVIQAFEGTAQLVDNSQSRSTLDASPAGGIAQDAGAPSDSGNDHPVYWFAVAGLLVLAAGVLLVRGRGRGEAGLEGESG